jgi:hypothetical protein
MYNTTCDLLITPNNEFFIISEIYRLIRDLLQSTTEEIMILIFFSESTVCSYLSIFETRIQSESYEKKKQNNTTSDSISEGD